MTVIIEIMSTCRENGCEIEHVKREALKRKKKKKKGWEIRYHCPCTKYNKQTAEVTYCLLHSSSGMNSRSTSEVTLFLVYQGHIPCFSALFYHSECYY